MAYLVGYPIDFTPDGDRTQEALIKGAYLEMQRIYNFMAIIQNGALTRGLVNIKGMHTTVSNLPTDADIGDTYVVGSYMYTWTGSKWQVKTLHLVPSAGEDVYGTVRIGELSDLLEYRPDRSSVVTEKMVADFMAAQQRGMPKGSVVAWKQTVIPTGWAVCDGTKGTPDLRNKFIRGANNNAGMGGGSDTVTLSAPDVPAHTHTLNVNASIPEHSHNISVSVQSSTEEHDHIATVSVGSLSSSGAHSHGQFLPGSYLVVEGIQAPVEGQEQDSQYASIARPGQGTDGILWGSLRYAEDRWKTHTHELRPVLSVTSATVKHTHSVPYTLSTATTSAQNGVTTVTGPPSTTGAKITRSNLPLYQSLIYIMKL